MRPQMGGNPHDPKPESVMAVEKPLDPEECAWFLVCPDASMERDQDSGVCILNHVPAKSNAMIGPNRSIVHVQPSTRGSPVRTRRRPPRVSRTRSHYSVPNFVARLFHSLPTTWNRNGATPLSLRLFNIPSPLL